MHDLPREEVSDGEADDVRRRADVTDEPAHAIIGGQRDEVHTNVGLIRFTTEAGRLRCSGTLISPTVVLTAGHCTGDTGDSPATNVYVSFNTDLALDPLAAGITPEQRAARAANYITGTAHPDPDWDGKLSISKQHDQGVVVLDAPATTKWPGITPAPLLPVGALDANQGALKDETFTLVGYGVEIGPKKAQIVVTERRFTTSYLRPSRTRSSPSRSTTVTPRPAVAPVSATGAARRSGARMWSGTPPT